MKKKFIVLSGFALGLAPVLALAQSADSSSCSGFTGSGTANTTLITILCQINKILGIIVPILIALGVVYFIWGVISYVIGTDEEAKASGRQKIIYGIIGLAVIIGVWGLVGILNKTFGVGAAGVVTPVVPGFNNTNP